MAEMPQMQETQSAETPEVQEPEVQEPEAEENEAEGTAQTSFIEIVEALTMGQGQLSRLKQANSPQVLRQFLLNDLYPILIEMGNLCNWYVGNLHDRVSDLEEDQGMGEGISPEFANDLMQYIGVSLQVFGELIPLIQTNPEMLHKVQLLVAQAPGLMSRIQDATMVEDDDDDDDDIEEDVPEVIEPTSQQEEKSASPEVDTSAPAQPAPEPEASPNVTAPASEESPNVTSVPVEEVMKPEEPEEKPEEEKSASVETPEAPTDAAPEQPPEEQKSASPAEEKSDG